MKATAVLLGGVGVCALLITPGYAQQQTSGPTPAAVQPSGNGPTGSLQKVHGKWRISKLIGANVYNQGGQVVGSIDDLLIGDDGKATDAILSVGGFLGIGTKLVSVPFDQLQFEPSRTTTAAGSAGGVTSGAGGAAGGPGIAAAPGTGAPGAVGGNAGAPSPAPAAGVAPATTTSSEYYSLVLPNATKDSLRNAPEFRYNR